MKIRMGIHAGGLGPGGVSGNRVLKDLGLHRELEYSVGALTGTTPFYNVWRLVTARLKRRYVCPRIGQALFVCLGISWCKPKPR